jgi:hypothetical protein
MDYGVDSQGSILGSRLALGSTQGALSPGVKRPGREAEHPPSLVLRSRMVELYIHSAIFLHGLVLI